MRPFGGDLSSSITSRFPGLATREGEVQTNDSCSLYTSPDKLSDELLILNICKGDLDALASLFRRYAHIVRGVAYRVLRDASEADDLVQDIFLLVHRLCRTFDSSKAPAHFWILQMAYRRSISRRRYLNSRHFYTQVELDEQSIRGRGTPIWAFRRSS